MTITPLLKLKHRAARALTEYWTELDNKLIQRMPILRNMAMLSLIDNLRNIMTELQRLPADNYSEAQLFISLMEADLSKLQLLTSAPADDPHNIEFECLKDEDVNSCLFFIGIEDVDDNDPGSKTEN